MNESHAIKLFVPPITLPHFRRRSWRWFVPAVLCLVLPPSLLFAASPSEAELKQGASLEKKLREMNEFIASADTAAITSRLAELCVTLPMVKWETVYGGVPAEPNALRSSWFKNALAYPIDSGLAASNADAFIGYLSAREMFSVLIEKDVMSAMRVLEESADKEPTLLHAMFCGVLLQASDAAGKAAALRSRLDDALLRGAWQKLLAAKNPIIRALGLELAPSDVASSPTMTEALRGALASEWVSLHHRALDVAEKHRPPNVAGVIDAYLTGLPSRPESAAVKESLRAKAFHAKGALSTPRPGGGS